MVVRVQEIHAVVVDDAGEILVRGRADIGYFRPPSARRDPRRLPIVPAG